MLDVKKELWTYKICSYFDFTLITFMSVEREQVVSFQFSDREKNDVERNSLFLFLKNNISGLIGYGNYNYDYQILHNIIKTLNVKPSDIFNHSTNLANRAIDLVYEKEFIIPQLDLNLLNGLKGTTIGEISLFMNYGIVLNRPHEAKSFLEESDRKDITEYAYHCVNVIRHFYRYSKPAVDLRSAICKKYGVRVMNKPDNDLGYRIFLSKYFDKTGKTFEDIKGKKDLSLSFQMRDLVCQDFKFYNPVLKDLYQSILDDDKDMYEYVNEDKTIKDKSFKKIFLIGDCELSFTLGGLHSINKPNTYESDDDGDLIELDFRSFFPSLIVGLNLYPPQLGVEYVDCVKDMIKIKYEAEEKGDDIEIQTMKKALNSIYGLLGYDGKPICSYKTMYSVTLNGQLYMLKLIELMVAYGMKPVLVCTDGCVFKVKDTNLMDSVIKDWLDNNPFKMDITSKKYDKLFVLNVNEYLAVDEIGNTKARGTRFSYKADPSKDSSFRIIAKSLEAYFIRGIPYRDFIFKHNSIFDFCGKIKFSNKYIPILTSLDKYGFEMEQKVEPLLRYYASTETGVIKKRGLKVPNNELYGYEDTVVKERNCTIVNKIMNKDPKAYKIDYNFYFQEIGKIINLIENVQLKLF